MPSLSEQMHSFQQERMGNAPNHTANLMRRPESKVLLAIIVVHEMVPIHIGCNNEVNTNQHRILEIGHHIRNIDGIIAL